MKAKVNILGTEYRIEEREEKDDKNLTGLNGYCAPYKKLIVIRKDFEEKPEEDYIKETLRHEIIHAFFYESGLWDCSNTITAWATNEELTDWIAIQGLKIIKAWEEVDAI